LSKKKWSVTLSVTEVKGGAGIDMEVDVPFGHSAPPVDKIVKALRLTAERLEQEAIANS
jgi:hypothetical protein